MLLRTCSINHMGVDVAPQMPMFDVFSNHKAFISDGSEIK
jgi:hypothetical protein